MCPGPITATPRSRGSCVRPGCGLGGLPHLEGRPDGLDLFFRCPLRVHSELYRQGVEALDRGGAQVVAPALRVGSEEHDVQDLGATVVQAGALFEADHPLMPDLRMGPEGVKARRSAI